MYRVTAAAAIHSLSLTFPYTGKRRMTVESSSEIMKATGKGKKIFRAVKEKEISTPELVKISFKYKGEMKTFSDK